MDGNEYYKIEDKKYENTNKYKKDNQLDIKPYLFQQLTTQSSRKIKNRDNDESSYINSKYLNYFNLNNNEDNNYKNKKNFYENKIKSEKKNSKLFMRNDNNDLLSFYSKSQIQNKNLFFNSNTNLEKFETDNFKNNEDLIYILTTNKNDNEKETDDESESYHYERNTSHIALPFCRYHKYNILLPKQYTCNFKKCSCCAFPEKINSFYENNNNYKNNNANDKLKNKVKKNIEFKSVLDKFKKKKKKKENQDGDFKRNKKVNKNKDLDINRIINTNEEDNLKNLLKNDNINKKNNLKSINKDDNENNSKYLNKNDILNKSNYSKDLNKNNNYNQYKAINLNKTKISDSSESNDLGDFKCNFQKPNNINIKIAKNDYISENGSKNESSRIELPNDFNIDDERDLKKYKNYVNQSEKKTKLHLSVMYYKKLNKSFNQIYSKDINKSKKIRSESKDKKFELLREE